MELFHRHSTDYSTNFGVFLLDQIAHVVVTPSISPKLISRKITFEVFQVPTYVITVPKRYRQTDAQTTYCGIRALCVASRGKKVVHNCQRCPKKLRFVTHPK